MRIFKCEVVKNWFWIYEKVKNEWVMIDIFNNKDDANDYMEFLCLKY